MTHKHFEDLADALRSTNPGVSHGIDWFVWGDTVKAIAEVCEKHNPRFDRIGFLVACGIDHVLGPKKNREKLYSGD